MAQSELQPEIVIASKSDIAEGLRARYDSTRLTPGEVHEITPIFSKRHEMATYGDAFGDVDQHLRAIIKAGDEYFGVVEVSSINRSDPKCSTIKDNTVLTRHLPNDRATFVGFIDSASPSLEVGWKYQPGLSSRTSKEHFAIAQGTDGYIFIVEPEKTTNGTEVFTPSINRKNDFSTSLLHMDTIDPAGNSDFWSVKPADLNAFLGVQEASKAS